MKIKLSENAKVYIVGAIAVALCFGIIFYSAILQGLPMCEFDLAAMGIKISALITTTQFDELVKLKFNVVNNGVYVDDVIDWLRRKYKIVIYDKIEPFVDPKTHTILYRMAVKQCNLRDGWNGRVYIGESRLTKNIYAAKREAIWLAIRWIKKQNHGKTKDI